MEFKCEEVKVSASKSLCRSLKFTGKNCIGTVDSIGWKAPRDEQTVITAWKHGCNQKWKQPLEAQCGSKVENGKWKQRCYRSVESDEEKESWKQLASSDDPLESP